MTDTASHGYTARKDSHLKRLRRIEGQVRGLQRMVEEDQYCIDILTQVSAATKALQALPRAATKRRSRCGKRPPRSRGSSAADRDRPARPNHRTAHTTPQGEPP
jgi:hypothetical protein